MARYSVNAGQLGAKSWYNDEKLEGSRFVGEGGHFIDTLAWWFDAVPTQVYSMASKDPHDVQVNMRFSDGSVAIISYVTNGNPRYPKEILDVSASGRSARLDNFRRSTVWSGRRKRVARGLRGDRQGPSLTARGLPGLCAFRRGNAHLARFARRDNESHARCRNEPSERQSGAGLNRQRIEWYWRRLRRMSASEVAWRWRDAAWQAAWARRQVRPGDAVRWTEPRLGPAITALLPDGTRDRIPGPATQALTNEAEAILKGHLTLLGTERHDLIEPDWFYDPVTGRHAPSDDYSFSIEHRSESVTGNVKQIWELSRLQHLTLLSAAWYATHDDTYARTVESQLRSWWTENPFLSGVNWTSGIEVGLRLISFVWIRRLLDGWPGVPALFEDSELAIAQIAWHQEYLSRFRSRGSSANNHVIAEAAGQLVASCAFPWYPQSGRWREESAELLERELVLNTFPSGLNREQASDYHGFVAELGLVAAVEADASGHPLTPATWALLARMLDAEAAILDVKLRPARQGDSDEGRALVLDASPVARPSILLAAGSALVGPAPWWPDVDQGVTSTVLGALGAGHARVVRGRPAVRPSHFPDAGLTLLRSGSDVGPEIWCRCDGGPHGYLSIAGHAHADALSVEIRFGGVDIVVDPGTYCYHGEPEFQALLPVDDRTQHGGDRVHRPVGLGRPVPMAPSCRHRGRRGGRRSIRGSEEVVCGARRLPVARPSGPAQTKGEPRLDRPQDRLAGRHRDIRRPCHQVSDPPRARGELPARGEPRCGSLGPPNPTASCGRRPSSSTTASHGPSTGVRQPQSSAGTPQASAAWSRPPSSWEKVTAAPGAPRFTRPSHSRCDPKSLLKPKVVWSGDYTARV